MMLWRKHRFAMAVLLALVGIIVLLSACAGEATPTPTPRPPTPTPVPPTVTPLPPTPTPTPRPPTPTPTTVPPGVTPPPATPTPTPPSPAPTPTPKPPTVGGAPVNTISDAEWDRIVAEARKEGKLTCYCFDLGRDLWLGDLATKVFKDSYGITFEVISAPPAIIAERIKSEERAGQYIADVVAIGAPWHEAVFVPARMLKRIDNLPALADVKDPNAWLFSPILTPYTILRADMVDYPAGHYTVNTNVVTPERYPQKPQDLLDPWWKEKKLCEWEPAVYTAVDYKFWNYFRSHDYAEGFVDYFYDLYNKGDRIFFSFGPGTALNKGDCAISVAFSAVGPANIKQGAVLSKVTWLKPGAFADLSPVTPVGTDAISVLAKAPHPNAALLFANWRFSKEGQEAIATEQGGIASVARLDAPFLLEKKYWPANPVTTYWIADAPWYIFGTYSFSSKGVFKLSKEGVSREAWRKWTKDTSVFFWGQYPPPPTTFFTLER